MKKKKISLMVSAIALSILTFFLIGVHLQNSGFDQSENLYRLSEFEETVLNGKEYTQLPQNNCICYVAYDSSYNGLYIYVLEKQLDEHYVIDVVTGGIGFTMDGDKQIASEFIFYPLQMKMIFSPTPIDHHEGYQEIVFSDAYLYISEVSPLCSPK